MNKIPPMMFMKPIWKQINLNRLALQTSGRAEVTIGLIDGPVDSHHNDLVVANIKKLGADQVPVCTKEKSPACIHGTFIAGILTARPESRAPGISPKCKLLVSPVFCEAMQIDSCPVVTPATLARHILEMVDAGANIINLSVGMTQANSLGISQLKRAYDYAQKNAVLIVGASGNQGQSIVNPLFNHPWVIPVASIDDQGRIDRNANISPAMVRNGLLAPGVDVLSISAGGGYTTMSGTSIAAPFVTGILALLWSRFPNITAKTLRQALFKSGSKTTRHLPQRLNADLALNYLQNISSKQRESITMQELEMTTSEDVLSKQMQADKASLKNEGNNTSGNSEIVMATIDPQNCGCEDKNNCACGSALSVETSYVYAIGRIRLVFPRTDIQKEFESAADCLKLPETDYYGVLSYQDNNGYQSYLYIAEQVCWVMDIEGVDSYFIVPRSSLELQELIKSLKPKPDSLEDALSIVIGPKGSDAPTGFCNGMQLPVVMANQLYYGFNFQDLIKQLSSTDLEAQSVRMVLEALEAKPNRGDSDELRAMNYIAFRYPEIYIKSQELTNGGRSGNNTNESSDNFLQKIDSQTNPQGDRMIVDIIFYYQQYNTGKQTSLYTGIDVTGQFPFISSNFRDYIPAP